MLGSPLVGCSKEMLDEALTQQANARSIRDEMVWDQNVAKDLEGRVAELEAKKQHVVEELKRMKEDHDATLERHEKEMAELKEKKTLAKTSAIEEYKSSNDFKKSMEKAVSMYFGEGFDLCKK